MKNYKIKLYNLNKNVNHKKDYKLKKFCDIFL